MYYEYTLSMGEYSDYAQASIFHKEEFTAKQFAQMYNECLDLINNKDGYYGFDELAEKLCEKFGFKQFEFAAGVHAGYGSFVKVPLEKLTDGEREICLDDF